MISDKRQIRESKYELMRIIAMIFITINHAPCSHDALIQNIYWRKFFFLGGQFGVDLFVIIGAWFLSQFKRWTSKGIINIILKCVFYSLFLDAVAYILIGHLSVEEIMSSFSYWFCFGYIFMLIFYPQLLKMPEKIKIVIVGMGGGITGYITILGYLEPHNLLIWIVSKGIIIGPIWFSYIFIVVSLIAEHWKTLNSKIHFWGWALLFCCSYLFMYFSLIMNSGTYIRDLHSPICLISAIGMFGMISNLDINYSKLINSIAECTFGMYLLQAHQIFHRFIWNEYVDFIKLSEITVYWPIYVLLSVPVIFIAVYAIDTLFKTIIRWRFSGSIINRIVNLIDLFAKYSVDK